MSRIAPIYAGDEGLPRSAELSPHAEHQGRGRPSLDVSQRVFAWGRRDGERVRFFGEITRTCESDEGEKAYEVRFEDGERTTVLGSHLTIAVRI